MATNGQALICDAVRTPFGRYVRGMAATIMPYGAVASELGSGRLTARRIVDPRLIQTRSVVRSTRSMEVFAEFEPAIMDYLSALAALIVERQNGLARLIP